MKQRKLKIVSTNFLLKTFFLFSFVLYTLGVLSVTVLATPCYLDIHLVNQDPYPAVPGSYVEVLFEVDGIENPNCKDISFKLNLDYPFSLNPGSSSMYTISGGEYSLRGSNLWKIPYKLLVDEHAVDSEYDIIVMHNNGQGVTPTIKEEFNVSVEDIRTSFDLVVQESTGNEVSLAIANVGKNPANSLIVRIPEQEQFRVSGTSGQMVGNLDAGDYSIVGFSVLPSGRGSGEESLGRMLQVQIDYTDIIGERRSVINKVPFTQGGNVPFSNLQEGSLQREGTSERTFTGGRSAQQDQEGFFTKRWFWLLLVILVVLSIYMYTDHAKKFIKKVLFRRTHDFMEKNVEEPDWVTKTRKKKK
jgi:hypothetical protein